MSLILQYNNLQLHIVLNAKLAKDAHADTKRANTGKKPDKHPHSHTFLRRSDFVQSQRKDRPTDVARWVESNMSEKPALILGHCECAVKKEKDQKTTAVFHQRLLLPCYYTEKKC